jgi:hypothetical protein
MILVFNYKKMFTITLENATLERNKFVDEKDLFLYVIEHLNDLKDVSDVKYEMENDN